MTIDDNDWKMCRESWMRIESGIQVVFATTIASTGTMGLYLVRIWREFAKMGKMSVEECGGDACTLVPSA